MKEIIKSIGVFDRFGDSARRTESAEAALRARLVLRALSVPDVKRVILESPYAGDIEEHWRPSDVAYLKAAMKDCLENGEAPFASHAIYPQVYDDAKPHERKLGMDAGFAWIERADYTVAYIDRGISAGMIEGCKRAAAIGKTIYVRSLHDKLSMQEQLAMLRQLKGGI